MVDDIDESRTCGVCRVVFKYVRLYDAHLVAGLCPKQEAVNHPSHYGGDTVYETIKVIKAWGLGFSLGNAVKYISRAGKKDSAKTVEDLKKARFYLDDEIATLEKGLTK